MSTTITIEKNLICEQDVLIGRDSVQQVRAGATVVANPLRLLAVVDSIEHLKTLDTSKYDFAFIRRDFPVVEEGEPEPELSPGANEFYALDFASTDDEDIPTIVQPNETVVGRWKQITIGEAGVKALITEEVSKALQNLEATIDGKIQTTLEVQVPQEIANALKSLTVKGFEFNSTLKYKQNDYVKAFVHSKGVITERLYMVDKETPDALSEVNYAPLAGDTYRVINGTTIYEDNSSLQEKSGYVRVYTVEGLKKTLSVTSGSNYKIYEPTGAVYPKGTLRLRALKAGKVSGYMEIVFGGTSHQDFSFRNVQYAKSVRAAAATSAYGYIFYPGFAVYCDETYFGLSVSSTTYVDSFELDYTDIDLVPDGTPASFVTNKCYAIREGGGSYIPNIGSTFFSMRNAGLQSGVSEDFYNFMSGSIPWTAGITLDTNLYHQYAAACVMPTMDNSGRFTRNMGGNSANVIGGVQAESLPNIKGKTGNTSEDASNGNAALSMSMSGEAQSVYGCSMRNGWEGALYAVSKRPNDVGFPPGTPFWSADRSQVNGDYYRLYLEFDASRSSSIYQNGAHVNPVSITKQERLQVF